MRLESGGRTRSAHDASLACSRHLRHSKRIARGAQFRDRIAIVVKASPEAIFQALHEVALRDMKFAWAAR